MRVKQRGATLLVGLIMLVLLTLLAISAINMSTVNLRITGNIQAQVEAAAAAQQEIERIIDNIDNFNNPQPIAPRPVGNYTVTVQTPVCLYAQSVPAGYSYSSALSAPLYVPEETTWDIQASATDSQTTGVFTTIHQGVRVILKPNKCP